MGTMQPNREFPGNSERVMKKKLKGQQQKDRDGRIIVNTYFFGGA